MPNHVAHDERATFPCCYRDHAKPTADNRREGIGPRGPTNELTLTGVTVIAPQTCSMLPAGFAMIGFASRRCCITDAA
jgi:hypothetical protein